MPHSSIAGSVSGLSVTSRTSRVSHATTIRSVATLTDTLKTKTGLSIPILPDAIFTNVQRGSVLAATYSIVSAVKDLFLFVRFVVLCSLGEGCLVIMGTEVDEACLSLTVVFYQKHFQLVELEKSYNLAIYQILYCD